MPRRPVDQRARYGEWYNGDDSDLDEHLQEYNAEQSDIAHTATAHAKDRRKSALASMHVPDVESSADESEAHTRKARHVRRSTIAPGQVSFTQQTLTDGKVAGLH